MIYLLGQILLCLLIAGLIGVLIGWLLRGLGQRSRLEALRADWNSRLRSVEDERNELASAHDELSALLDFLKDENAKSGKETAGLRDELAKAQDALTETAEQKLELQSRMNQQKKALADREKELKAQTTELEAGLKESEAETTRLKETARTRGETIAALRSEEDRLRSELGTVREDHSQCSQRIAALNQRIEELEQKLTEQDRQLEEHTTELEARLKNREEKISQLERAAKVDNETVASLRSDEDRLRSELDTVREDHSQCSQRIAALNQRIEELEREGGQPSTVTLPAEAVPPPAAPSSEDRPAWLLTAPQGEQDDLRRIWGIGPVLERTLNDLGVYHFRQIARWSHRDIEWTAAHVQAFPDRIERDGWVEQAKRLHFEKYGEEIG